MREIAGEIYREFDGSRSAVAMCEIRQATGIPADDILTPRQIRAAAELVNLHPDQVREMTLERWTGTAYPASPHTSRKTQTHRWTWNTARDRCPTWLADRGLTRLSDCTRRQLRSRLIIDASDAVAAGWYRRRTN